MSDMLTVQQYAAKHNKAEITIRKKCQRGTLPGAVKIGRDWLIPEDANYPDNRVKSGKYVNWRKKNPAE